MLFLVKAGAHLVKDKENPKKTKQFNKGDVVESDVDLVERFGEKFAYFNAAEAQKYDKYDSMTDEELFELAEDRELDLQEGAARSDVLALLRKG